MLWTHNICAGAPLIFAFTYLFARENRENIGRAKI